MYIIEDGKAYLVDGEVANLVNFDTTGKMTVNKEKAIDVLGKVIYTYDEMYAKLNVAYMIEEKRKENALDGIENEVIDSLNAKITELENENEALKEQIKSLENAELENSEAEAPKDENADENKEENAELENSEAEKSNKKNK